LLVATSTVCSAAEGGATPKIVAHRGLIRHAPENTLASFRACLELHIGFELDVQRSKDGHLVCVHDDTVDRTTTGSGRVVDLTLAQLQDADAGSWFDPAFGDERVPTLNAVLAAVASYRHDVLIAIDLKGNDGQIEGDCVKLAKVHNVLKRLLFIGRTIRNPEVRRRLRKADDETQIAVVANSRGELSAAMEDPLANWVYVRYVPSQSDVARVHAKGQLVFVSGPTVAGQEPENWQQATASGVDGILTDFPLVLRQTLRDE
jgi:glycerophosphoryl diester phosphodiesterase